MTFAGRWLEKMFESAVEWSNNNGEMHDPYESIYAENFSPACWSVVAAVLYSLTHKPEHLDWCEKWITRAAELMEANPPMRDYILGYAAMIFPVLRKYCAPDVLEKYRILCADTYKAEFPVSSDMHITALQLVGDIYCPRNRKNQVSVRQAEILTRLENRVNELGFLTDDRDNGNSIPHMLLTGCILSIFIVDEDLECGLKERIIGIVKRNSYWFGRMCGQNHLPVQANRSYNQMYVYSIAALFAFLEYGIAGKERINSILKFQKAFMNTKGGIAAITPNYFSPYCLAGAEANYNRVVNDAGAGAVAWALLLLLAENKWNGFNTENDVPEEKRWCDAASGYAVFKENKFRVFFALRTHKWQYHLPLQPISLGFPSQLPAPFCGAKRSGVNNPYLKSIPDSSRLDPLLEPYFGLYSRTPEGKFHNLEGQAAELPDGTWKLENKNIKLNFTVKTENGGLILTYRYSMDKTDKAFFAVPVLLWDGRNELEYKIERNIVRMIWNTRKYFMELSNSVGNWNLAIERHAVTGYGITGNFVIPIASDGKIELALKEKQ